MISFTSPGKSCGASVALGRGEHESASACCAQYRLTVSRSRLRPVRRNRRMSRWAGAGVMPRPEDDSAIAGGQEIARWHDDHQPRREARAHRAGQLLPSLGSRGGASAIIRGSSTAQDSLHSAGDVLARP
jgi:hypothetical protein